MSSCKASIVTLSKSADFIDPYRMTDWVVFIFNHQAHKEGAKFTKNKKIERKSVFICAICEKKMAHKIAEIDSLSKSDVFIDPYRMTDWVVFIFNHQARKGCAKFTKNKKEKSVFICAFCEKQKWLTESADWHRK